MDAPARSITVCYDMRSYDMHMQVECAESTTSESRRRYAAATCTKTHDIDTSIKTRAVFEPIVWLCQAGVAPEPESTQSTSIFFRLYITRILCHVVSPLRGFTSCADVRAPTASHNDAALSICFLRTREKQFGCRAEVIGPLHHFVEGAAALDGFQNSFVHDLPRGVQLLLQLEDVVASTRILRSKKNVSNQQQQKREWCSRLCTARSPKRRTTTGRRRRTCAFTNNSAIGGKGLALSTFTLRHAVDSPCAFTKSIASWAMMPNATRLG